MLDIRSLPDAWDAFYELVGEEGSKNDDLYDIYYRISTTIFDYRIKKKLTQKQLAQRLEVTQAMVSKLESGDYNYSVEQLWKISQKLGLKLEISLEEKGEEILVRTEEQAEVIEYPGMVVG